VWVWVWVWVLQIERGESWGRRLGALGELAGRRSRFIWATRNLVAGGWSRGLLPPIQFWDACGGLGAPGGEHFLIWASRKMRKFRGAWGDAGGDAWGRSGGAGGGAWGRLGGRLGHVAAGSFSGKFIQRLAHSAAGFYVCCSWLVETRAWALAFGR